MSIIDRQQIEPFLKSEMPLIPIHRWDSKDSNGKERGKAPRDKSWPVKEYTREAIDKWIRKGGNVGVRLRDIDIVIDVDPKNDPRGRTAAQLVTVLELHLGIDLSNCPVVETGSGGWHIYLRRAEGGKIKRYIDEFKPAIEFKTRGSQVLAPGCKHPNGKRYRWHRKVKVGEVPPELLAAILKPNVVREYAPSLSEFEITKCLDQLDPENFRDYEDWRNIMFAIHDASDGDPATRDLFVTWSTRDPDYETHGPIITEMWDAAESGREDGRTARTLFWYVTEAGGTIPVVPANEDFEPLPPEPDPDGLPEFRLHKGKLVRSHGNLKIALKRAGVRVLFDEFSLRQKITLPEESAWPGEHPLSESTALMAKDLVIALWEWVSEPGVKSVLNALAMLSFENRVHPLREYLDSLHWDGKKRLESWLVDASELVDSRYSRAVSRILLFSAVARAYRPGVKWDVMIVMEGPQGANKSMLIQHLGGEWAAEGLPPLRSAADKDVIDAMQGRWLIEIEELAVTRKADQDVLKAFLSKTEDRMRPPYGITTINFPRQCIFIGTTNDTTYLRDLTGNRRVLPLYVGHIRLGGIDTRQLWAEAVVEWKKKPVRKVELHNSLWGRAADQQEDRLAEDPWEQQMIEFVRDARGKGFVPSNEILISSSCVDGRARLNRGHTMKLAAIMQRLGIRRSRSQAGVRGYIMPEERED